MQKNDFSVNDINQQSVTSKVMLATEPILSHARNFCSLLAECIQMDTAENGEVSGARQKDTSASSVHSACYVVTNINAKPNRCNRLSRAATDLDHSQTENDETKLE